MDDESSSITYLKLKEFLARNPAVLPRTFSRWKKQGLIDFIQPGGPNTQILVPEDALQRMEQRDRESSQRRIAAEDSESKGVRGPNWTKNIKQIQTRKENDG